MERLPKRISTNLTPKFLSKKWIWIGSGVFALSLYVYYILFPFPPKITSCGKANVIKDSVADEMDASTPQDLQSLPLALETAEEAIALEDFQNDELVQIFEQQEQNTAKNNLKPKEPLVVRRSLGLV